MAIEHMTLYRKEGCQQHQQQQDDNNYLSSEIGIDAQRKKLITSVTVKSSSSSVSLTDVAQYL